MVCWHAGVLRAIGKWAAGLSPAARRTLAGMLARLPLGASFARGLSWLLEVAPLLKSAAGVTVGLGILCVALAIYFLV